MKAIKMLICFFKGHKAGPYVSGRVTDKNRKPKGDYADRWSVCERCGAKIHMDAHMYGDGIWHKEDWEL